MTKQVLKLKAAKVNFYVFLILMIIHNLTHEKQRTENEQSQLYFRIIH
jgi:hypothetical protein